MTRTIAGLALLLAPFAASAKKAPSLPVMQIEPQNGADPRLASLASDAVAESLRDLDVFKIISSDDIKKILSFQRDKAMVGAQCTEDHCLAEIGGALGADFMVSGKLTRIGNGLKLELQLFNNAKAKVDNAVSAEDLKDDHALEEAAKQLARRVVAPILEKSSGQLFITVTDPGAAGAVENIDDRTVGITVPPTVQPAPVPLGWGPHHVIVRKEGFLTYEKDVQIDEGQSTTLVVTLIPSPDFIDAYRSRNERLRIGSYVGGGAAVVLGGLSFLLNQDNIQQYKRYSNALFQRDHAGATPTTPGWPYPHNGGCETLKGGCSSDAALNAAASQGRNELLEAQIGAGLAVASAITAVTLFVLSDNPGRYDNFLQVSPASQPASPGAHSSAEPSWQPAVALSPMVDGAYASFGVRF